MTIGVAARAAAGLVMAVALLAPAAAGATDGFYAGKTLTIVAGYRPGGGVDATARMIARHLARHLRGQPRIVVSNLAGATGGAAANFLYEKAAPDGLTLAVPGRTWMLSRVLNEPGVRFDPLRFAFIGSPGPSNNKLWVRADSNVRTVDDLRRAKRKLVMGALSLRATNGSVPLVLSHDGLPVDVLPGYSGTPHILEAIARREIDGFFGSDDTIRATRSDLLERRVIVPILQSVRELAGVPLLDDVVSAKSRPLLDLALTAERFGMPLVGPAGMPRDRIAMLRAAFHNMAADPAYRADAQKLGGVADAAIDGEALEKMIAAAIAAATPAVVRQFTEYTRGHQAPGRK